MSAADGPARDLRLVPAAALAWLTVALVLPHPAAARTVAIALLLGAIVGVGAAVGVRVAVGGLRRGTPAAAALSWLVVCDRVGDRGAGERAGPVPWIAVVMQAAVACAAAATGAAAVVAATGSPQLAALHRWQQAGVQVDAVVIATGSPHPGAVGSGQVVPTTALCLTTATGAERVGRTDLLVLLDGGTWESSGATPVSGRLLQLGDGGWGLAIRDAPATVDAGRPPEPASSAAATGTAATDAAASGAAATGTGANDAAATGAEADRQSPRPATCGRQPAVLRDAVTSWAASVRRWLSDHAERSGGAAAALVPGLAVGDTAMVTATSTAQLRLAGLSHVTAVSGAHLVMVAGAAALLASAVRVRGRLRLLVVVAVSALFLVIAVPSASVTRAAVMAGVGAVGALVARPARVWSALSIAVLGMVVADPAVATDLGFGLSVCATAGLALVVTRPSHGSGVVRRVGLAIGAVARASAAAQLACLPLLVALRPSIGLWTVPANVLVAPVIAPATLAGLGAGLVGDHWPLLSDALFAVAKAAAGWVLACARVTTSMPGATIEWAAGPVGIAAQAGVSCAMLALLIRAQSPGHGRLARWRQLGFPHRRVWHGTRSVLRRS